MNWSKSIRSLQISVWVLTIIYTHGFPLNVGYIDSKFPNNNKFFEGDLKISKEMILKNYDFSSVPQGEKLKLDILKHADDIDIAEEMGQNRYTRAVGSESGIKLWNENIVEYNISEEFTSSEESIVMRAINYFEEKTCLKFLPITEQTVDYIQFIKDSFFCYSDSVGKKGGKQVIGLGEGCIEFGIIVHEIGHAIGFWHEQSRPDRDEYITFHEDRLLYGFGKYQFMKRKYTEIDYQGSIYDYGSIMHYSQTAFSSFDCSGSNCTTITVNNEEEYNRQGRPTIGMRIFLSAQDIAQANRLYSCSCKNGEGQLGNLTFFLRQGFDLVDESQQTNKNGEGQLGNLTSILRQGLDLVDESQQTNKSGLYVKLTAVDCSGNAIIEHTNSIYNDSNPIWNEQVSMGSNTWQFFRISVWYVSSSNFGDDSPVTMSQTVLLQSGHHQNIKHCNNASCNSYILFDYDMATQEREIKTSTLQIRIHSAVSLLPSNSESSDSFPFVRIQATRDNNMTTIQTTRLVYNDTIPTWNQWLNFSCALWTSIQIQVFNYDSHTVRDLSDKESVLIKFGTHTDLVHVTRDKGSIIYDYNYDKGLCSTNPCKNGGTCTETCSTFRCSCPHTYAGSLCDYPNFNITITPLHVQNMQTYEEEDGVSNPYLEFLAIDWTGKSVRLNTTYVQNSNYTWNEQLHLEFHAWTEIRVKVAADIFKGDFISSFALTNQDIFLPSEYTSHKNIMLECIFPIDCYAAFEYCTNC